MPKLKKFSLREKTRLQELDSKKFHKVLGEIKKKLIRSLKKFKKNIAKSKKVEEYESTIFSKSILFKETYEVIQRLQK